MRPAPNAKIEKCRITTPASLACAGTNAGAFRFGRLQVIASDGGGWDHVSVVKEGSPPSWEDMCFVKHQFFREDEVVMQLHPAKADYINVHKNCLHLWRPQTQAERDDIVKRFGGDCFPHEAPSPIPLPPKDMVG